MSERKQRKPITMFEILTFIGFLALLCIFAAFIVWVWCGWFYFWRTFVTGIIAWLSSIMVPNYYRAFLKPPVNDTD